MILDANDRMLGARWAPGLGGAYQQHRRDARMDYFVGHITKQPVKYASTAVRTHYDQSSYLS